MTLPCHLEPPRECGLGAKNTPLKWRRRRWRRIEPVTSQLVKPELIALIDLQWQPESAALVHLLARQYRMPHATLTDKPTVFGVPEQWGLQVAPPALYRCVRMGAVVFARPPIAGNPWESNALAS
jgi:hypothetical protein